MRLWRPRAPPSSRKLFAALARSIFPKHRYHLCLCINPAPPFGTCCSRCHPMPLLMPSMNLSTPDRWTQPSAARAEMTRLLEIRLPGCLDPARNTQRGRAVCNYFSPCNNVCCKTSRVFIPRATQAICVARNQSEEGLMLTQQCLLISAHDIAFINIS